MKRILGLAIVIGLIAGLAWWNRQAPDTTNSQSDTASGRVAVKAGAVTTGSIADVRRFTGTLEASDAFTVAPKIGGQIRRIRVDIGDRVEKGEIIVELDNAEATQAVAEARAELEVARAEVRQAKADARLAGRALERTRSLADRNLAAASELDTKQAEAKARDAAVAVAEARVSQRRAALARAQVQLGYTSIRADWRGGDDERVVGERMINAGETVAANTPLVSILGIDPITAVAYASERDYGLLSIGQRVTVTADALPGREFTGQVQRIAPRFAQDSRQARFEVRIPNDDRALKPGMFVTVQVTVATADGATLVPNEAIVRRTQGPGVYRINADQQPPTVTFVPIDLGLEGGQRSQIRSPELSGRVVTLGQQLLKDGARVIVPATADAPDS